MYNSMKIKWWPIDTSYIDEFIKTEELIREEIINVFGIPEVYFREKPVSTATEMEIRMGLYV